jgi:electron transfer flavoprotein alpha subunit
MSGEVWVWLPREREGALAPAAAELLYEAGALARRLDAALVAAGDRAPQGDESALLGRWGVARVRVLGTALPPHPVVRGGASPLRPLLEAARGEGAGVRAVLLAADSFGRVAAPLLAAELGAVGGAVESDRAAAELVTGATSVTTDGRRFVAARPTLGGQYEALAHLPLERPLVVTLRPGAVGAVEPPAGPDAAVPALEALAARGVPGEPAPVLLAPQLETLDLADAERIVAFGRGAFSPEAVELVRRLARALGAKVAGTRPAADEGWLPFECQVGLTGAIVQPRLYVAVGISGAPYHMVGVKEPETLIAINSDPDAPIFGFAHLGIVGDLRAVLPALLAHLEQGPGLPRPLDLPAGSRRP